MGRADACLSARKPPWHPPLSLVTALLRSPVCVLQPDAEVQEASREQLLAAVAEHFTARQVDEAEVIACFLGAVKRHRMGGSMGLQR